MKECGNIIVPQKVIITERERKKEREIRTGE